MDRQDKSKETRRTSSYFVIMNDGHIHVYKGMVSLNRNLSRLDPAKIQKIIKGHECKIVPVVSLSIQV